MKERPIIFSGQFIPGLLDGRKTQTRRLIKLPNESSLGIWEPTEVGGPGTFQIINGKRVPVPREIAIWHTRSGKILCCPHGVVGDRFWVKETFYIPTKEEWPNILYKADYLGLCEKKPEWCKWKPSIHMPRWASRITLEITGIRVERVNGITEEDALKEGMTFETFKNGTAKGSDPIDSFHWLWDAIYPGSWDRNDWVWVVEFKRVEQI